MGAAIVFAPFAPPHDGGLDGYFVRSSASNGAANGAGAWGGTGAATGDQEVRAVGVNGDGSFIVAGTFTQKVVLQTGGASLTSAGSSDGFVAMYTHDGTYSWGAHLAGTGDQVVTAMVVDPLGDVIVAGTASSSITLGALPTTATYGALDAFVAKIGNTGTPEWIKSFGSPSNDGVTALTVDGAGNITAVGYDQASMDFGDAEPLMNLGQANDVFAVHLDADGTYLWKKGFGKGGEQLPRAVTVDGLSGIYLAGEFGGTLDLDVQYVDPSAPRDLFITRLAATTGVPTWSTTVADANIQPQLALAWNPTAGLAVAGSFAGAVNFGGGTVQSDGVDAFVLALDPAHAFSWQKVFTGPGAQSANAAAYDAAGALFVTGDYAGPAVFDGASVQSNGGLDLFVVKYAP